MQRFSQGLCFACDHWRAPGDIRQWGWMTPSSLARAKRSARMAS